MAAWRPSRAGPALCVLVLAVVRHAALQWEKLSAPLGMPRALRGAAVFLSRTSLFAEMAVLLPSCSGTWIRPVVSRGLQFRGRPDAAAGWAVPGAATPDFPSANAGKPGSGVLQRLEPVFAVLLICRPRPLAFACRVCAASRGNRPPGLSSRRPFGWPFPRPGMCPPRACAASAFSGQQFG